MPKSEMCKYCKRFDKDTDECSKKSIERQCGPRLKLFIDTISTNNDPPKWKSSDVGIPVHVILSPMSVMTDPKRIWKIEIGD